MIDLAESSRRTAELRSRDHSNLFDGEKFRRAAPRQGMTQERQSETAGRRREEDFC